MLTKTLISIGILLPLVCHPYEILH